MKKMLFAVIAALFVAIFPSIASANTGSNTGLNAVSYYNANQAEWTFELPTLGATTFVDFVYPKIGLRTQKIICSNVRNMCYTSSVMLNSFKFDVDLFQKWQEEVTGVKVIFEALNDRLNAR